MGYVGGRVPGHSGTQFKHRKGFAVAKQHLQERQKRQSMAVSSSRSIPSSPKTSGRVFILWRLILILAILAAVIIGIQPFWNGFNDYREGLSAETVIVRSSPAVVEEALPKEPVLGPAQRFLRHGEVYKAQQLFQLATEAYPYHYDSNVGLAASLVFQCVDYNDNCERAREYLNFCFQLHGNEVVYLLALEKKLERGVE